MRKKHLPGYLFFGMFIVFVGSSALRGDFLEKTMTSAFVPTGPAAAISASEVEASQSKYEHLVEALHSNPQRLAPLPPSTIDTETLWLARAIYSETKRATEMELVAWVIRNRVETSYRGHETYREVVLDPFQFSAFNPDNGNRWYYANLKPQTDIGSWQRALTIAYRVRLAEPEYRPFSIKTRHFYSERSMLGRPHPNWAAGKRPVVPERRAPIDERRFRFFENVS